MAHGSGASCKNKVELDSHSDTCVVDEYSLVSHDHNRPVNVYSYDPTKATEVPKQLMLQLGIKSHRVNRSLS